MKAAGQHLNQLLEEIRRGLEANKEDRAPQPQMIVTENEPSWGTRAKRRKQIELDRQKARRMRRRMYMSSVKFATQFAVGSMVEALEAGLPVDLSKVSYMS